MILVSHRIKINHTIKIKRHQGKRPCSKRT
jgi:hypothetical protein